MSGVDPQKFQLDKHFIISDLWHWTGNDMQHLSGVAIVLGNSLVPGGWDGNGVRCCLQVSPSNVRPAVTI